MAQSVEFLAQWQGGHTGAFLNLSHRVCMSAVHLAELFIVAVFLIAEFHAPFSANPAISLQMAGLLSISCCFVIVLNF